VEEGFDALLALDDLDDYVRETLASAVLRVKDLKSRQPA
jgi:hypothetical protein